MADGHLNKCKECTKKDTIKNRNENLEYYQEYDRKRSNLEHRIKLRKQVAERWKANPKLRKRRGELKRVWQQRNAEKRAAHVITGNAIRDGRLIPKPCEVCGKKKVDAHHDDYAKPLEVRWLCKKHHAEYHVQKRGLQRIA
ncbi:MAG TPA: hypothetical protein VIH61_05330 [Waddliaceae bacterium]